MYPFNAYFKEIIRIISLLRSFHQFWAPARRHTVIMGVYYIYICCASVQQILQLQLIRFINSSDTGQSIGGCSYYSDTSHPKGYNALRFPFDNLDNLLFMHVAFAVLCATPPAMTSLDTFL